MASALGRPRLRSILVVVAAATATLTAVGTSAFAASSSTSSQASTACVSKPTTHTRVGHISGIVSAVPAKGCAGSVTGSAITKAGDNANGSPPLIWHGGAVMGTKLTGPLVVTPIFWNPAGHPMDAAYKSLITQYLGDVAKASGLHSNVYSISTEYSGTNGQISYQIKLGTPINDTNPLPANGCTVAQKDKANIYADNSGYNACIDDTQVIGEASSVVKANGLPRDFAHIYVVYLPKHVESCFLPGKTTTTQKGQACTINYQPTAAYCAYHSFVATAAGTSLVYANMPYPIYLSKTLFTCGTDVNFPGVVQTPNGNADADTEISPSSHEINEAWTDPDTTSGWFDITGFENGDECAYVFGPTQGPAGAFYNQVINGHHYLTQEEFSNQSFFASGGGCLQGE
jgi:hypothetical protein